MDTSIKTITDGKIGIDSEGNEENSLPRRLKFSTFKGESFTPPDGGWGWVVCMASVWVNGSVIATTNTYGIMYIAIETKFANDHDSIAFKASLVGPIALGMIFLLGIVAGILSDRIGIRPTGMIGAAMGAIGMLGSAFVEKLELLFITYGIILGFGAACMLSTYITILGHYFHKRLGIVNGIVTFGGGVITIVMSVVLPIVLREIGLRYTFILLSGQYVVSMGCAYTWKPLLKKVNDFGTGSNNKSCVDRYLNRRIWKCKGYVIWAVSLSVALLGFMVPYVHLFKYSQILFPESNGSYLVLCLNGAACVGKLVCGRLSDLHCINRIRLQQAAFTVLGIVTICIPFVSDYYSLIAVSLIIGSCDGFFICLIGPIVFDFLKPSDASQAVGFVIGMMAIPLSAGSPVAGALFDYLGSYNIAFHIAGIPPIVGALSMFAIPKKSIIDKEDKTHIVEGTFNLMRMLVL
ncbi:hypothetical protein SNE40_004941 [Patella caerulea]|uniref:Monocarboxylate transporter 10 n=1 Tax=Patella caerulea TaxID=87958 RepID=A0AAN8Q1I6_PATCE